MSTLVFGSSHLFAMKLGGGGSFDYKFLGDFQHSHRVARRSDTGEAEFFPDVAQWIEEAPPYDDVIVFIGGSNWLQLCLVARDPPFDFRSPARPDLPLDSRAKVVPYDMITARLDELYGDVLIVGLEAIAKSKLAKSRLWHLESPAPVRDNEAIRTYLTESPLPAWAKPDSIVGSPWLRMKCFLAYRDYVESACAKYGISFIRTPSAACDPDGFLLPHLAKDIMHATSDYGKLAIEDVKRALAPLAVS